MGSKDKFYSINTESHGYDDIGTSQPSGTISSVARYGGITKWRKFALVTASADHGLRQGQAVNIVGTTDYDGPTIVLAVPSTTKFLIKRAFTVTKTGNFNCLGGEGNWDAFMPLYNDLTATAIASFYMWKPGLGANGTANNGTAPAYTKDKVYIFPQGVRRILLGSGATYNLRLFRASSLRPGPIRSLIAPTIVNYSPTGATAGDTVEIYGTDFDPYGDNNALRFVSGGTAVLVKPSEVGKDGHWMTVTFPSGVVSTTGAWCVKTNGMNGTGPSFNVR